MSSSDDTELSRRVSCEFDVRLGIDFGTTRTVVAACDRGNYPVVSFDHEGRESHEFFPSVLAEKAGRLCFGFEALGRRGQPGWTVRTSFKRLLSSPVATPGKRVKVGSLSLELSTLITLYLEALKKALLEASNLPLADADDELEVVVATPANSFSTQRLVTLEAFRCAGFRVLQMLNEPSAAGIEYAHRYRGTLNQRRDGVLVYDLGGGTFDVSLVNMQREAHDVTTSFGFSRLGGDDFDAVLSGLALAGVGVSPDALGVTSRSRLRNHCREIKEAIHVNTKNLYVEFGACLSKRERERFGVDAEHVEVLEASAYEAACQPLIQRTLRLVKKTLGRADEGTVTALAGLYVVGGASALPAVARALRSDYGRRVKRSPYPSAAIAIGLSIAADAESPYRVSDRYHHSLGVFREADTGRQIDFDRIIGPETRLPAVGEPAVRISRRYRARHNLGHYRFVECGWLDSSGQPSGDIKPFANVLFPFDRDLQGRRDLEDVAIAAGPEGPEVEEEYRVDETGAVELTIRDLSSSYVQHHRISC